MRPLCANWREAGVWCALKRLAKEAEQHVEEWVIGGDFEEAAASAGGRRKAAATRLAFGAQLEEYAKYTISRIWPANRSELPDDAIARRWACQLYFDSYCAAVWTSAHAEYIAALDSGVIEPASPSITTVPCASCGFDLSDLYERRVAQTEAGPMIHLLSRCTNPGARGWDTMLRNALEHAGARAIVMHAIHTCLLGLHPQLHPSQRASWQVRMKVLRVMPQQNHDIRTVTKETKEALRRCLASTMAATPAMHTALSLAGHPVRHLLQPPAQFPHIGMETAMVAFANAGSMLSRGGQWPYCLRRAFDLTSSIDINGLSCTTGWLGKGTANVHARQPLVALSGDVWAAAFKAHFVAFWLFAQSHQLRVSRLDPAQHAAVHGLNKATQLASQVDPAVAMSVQRSALRNPASGIATLGEVAEELGITGIPLMSTGVGARSALEGVQLIGYAGPEPAGRLLSYARVAWVSEQILVVDLGSNARRMQLTALRKRLRLPANTDESALPMQATHLCACAECHRVANAQTTRASSQPFNELGITSCQLATDSPLGVVRLHCAKRSSAALRTAIAFETDMKRRCIEAEPVERAQLMTLTDTRHALGVDSGIAARGRRDAKNALEQRVRPVPCGEHPMFTIPIVGRAVRVYKQWYALCSYCAAVTRVTPGVHMYGAEVCCMRCDHDMLGVDDTLLGSFVQQSTGKICRFCGSVERQNTMGARWKELQSPLDIAGPNAVLPPPLRTVWYCPQHHKPWLMSAHRVMETRVILAHIAQNAKPIFGSEPDAQEARHKPAPAKKRKLRMKRN